MVSNVIFHDLCHQAVDTAAHVRQKHQYVGAVVAGGEGTFDGIHLSTNPLDARNELLFFLVEIGHVLLDDILWGYDIKNERGFCLRRREAKPQYEHKFRTRTSKYSEVFPVLR